MGAPKLKIVRLLKNHGAVVEYVGTLGPRQRFERPDGSLSVQEAAKLLGTYPNMVRRMAVAGRLKLGKGRRCVSVADVRALMRMPAGKRLTAERAS